MKIVRVMVVAMFFAVSWLAQGALAQGKSGSSSGIPGRVAALEAEVAALKALLSCVSKVTGTINGLTGPHLIFTGCNVHVRSGSGNTEDSSGLTGLGNLIVGYNEQDTPAVPRTGSHNLVVGQEHEYTSHGSFVAGLGNTVRGENATVSAGADNIASGDRSASAGAG